MTVSLQSGTAVELVLALFEAHGASRANAHAVAEHLVDSERLHLPSHGLIRVRQYLDEIGAGLLNPAAAPTEEPDGDTISHFDGHRGFGQVAGMAAAAAAGTTAAERGTAFVTVRNVQHTGRLGAYTESLARRGYVALATGSGAPRFHRVVPFGGRDGRLSTNPIAWAAPTANGVMSADFSTSAVPEGRIRVLHGSGLPAPEGTICDADGNPTTDPNLFYGNAEEGLAPGALLPLGGSAFGHKGYALALLGECLATLLAGDTTDARAGRANNLAILAIRGDEALPQRVTEMADYMKSSRPVVEGRDVLVPGEPERRGYRADAALSLPDFVGASLQQALDDAGVDVPERTFVQN